MTKPIPDGFHTLTPSMTFKDSKKALDYYQKAFGAKVLGVFPNPAGKGTMHAVMQIGDSIVMMGDEHLGGPDSKSAETLGGSPMSQFIYVPNVDAAFKQALAAGGKETMPVGEQFWGDRAGAYVDPFGYTWMIATHTRDLTPEQVTENAKAFFAQMAQK